MNGGVKLEKGRQKKKATALPKEVSVLGTQVLPPHPDLPVNPNIPTQFANIVNVLSGADEVVLLSFFSRSLGLNVEQCRVTIPNNLAIRLVDLLCDAVKYYPANPSEAKQ